MDPYAKEVVIMARDINKLTKIERMDTAERKKSRTSYAHNYELNGCRNCRK